MNMPYFGNGQEALSIWSFQRFSVSVYAWCGFSVTSYQIRHLIWYHNNLYHYIKVANASYFPTVTLILFGGKITAEKYRHILSVYWHINRLTFYTTFYCGVCSLYVPVFLSALLLLYISWYVYELGWVPMLYVNNITMIRLHGKVVDKRDLSKNSH